MVTFVCSKISGKNTVFQTTIGGVQYGREVRVSAVLQKASWTGVQATRFVVLFSEQTAEFHSCCRAQTQHDGKVRQFELRLSWDWHVLYPGFHAQANVLDLLVKERSELISIYCVYICRLLSLNSVA